MYGLVHTAARNMILETMEQTAWTGILQRAGLGDEHFVSGQYYPDAVTFRLLDAISSTAGITIDTLLRQFGRHWIEYSARSPFGGLYRIAGSNLETFLHNLNRMHSSVQTTMPKARMPVFEVIASAPGQIDLQYDSEREGLQSFVEGLLEGLLAHFGETGEVTCKTTPEGDVFRVLYNQARQVA